MEKAFQKRYDSPARLWQTVRNHRWMAKTGLPAPRLLGIDSQSLTLSFEHLRGRHATSAEDLIRVSAQLGRWHARLLRNGLLAGADSPAEPFVRSRERLLLDLQAPGALVGPGQLGSIESLVRRTPPSVYKDANARNVLVSDSTIHHVDFDDLSLAPAGYDLAKLLISRAMMDGRRPPMESALAAYNGAAEGELCDSGALAVWMEIHHVLTFRYLNRGLYRHPWSSARIAADAELATAALAESS